MKEEDVRPKAVFDEFLSLLDKDIETFFGIEIDRHEIHCVACGYMSDSIFCEKGGFVYKICDECMTIYASPRPEKLAFDSFYSDSPSTQFWASTFYKATEAARRENLWKPKARQVADILERKFGKTNVAVVDIGGGYGVFAEEIEKLGCHPVVVEPSEALSAVCLSKGLEVISLFVEDITSEELHSDGPKCLVSFELLEHVYSPRIFLEKLFALMNNGDLLIFTTLSGMGLDIQVLEGASNSISPPQHINFLNPRSIAILMEDIGFTDVVITTPGKLDVDIVMNNASLLSDGYWRKFIAYSDEEQKASLQEFCAAQGFSSHMMVVAGK